MAKPIWLWLWLSPLSSPSSLASKMVSVESTVETGHDDMIHDAQMDYYGTRLATCSSDK